MTKFRDMRRKRQMLSVDASEEILRNATSGVLAVNGDDGFPYAVPVSYVYTEGTILIHSAMQGYKVDAIRSNPKVSFCVIDADMVKPSEFTTYFRSVIAFGIARIIDDDVEKIQSLRLLADKYSDATVTADMTSAEINKGLRHLIIIEISIEHLSGKEAIELVREKTDQG